MASQKWESLTLEKQLVLITSDIEDLLREINSLTAPGGEVDEALNAALDSFIPMMSAYDLDNFEVSSEGVKAENVNLENSPRQHNRQNGSAVKKTSNEVEAGESYERSNSRKGRGMSSNRSSSGVHSRARARSSEVKFAKPESSEQIPRGRIARKSRMRGTKESVDDSVYESLTHYVNLRESSQEDVDPSQII